MRAAWSSSKINLQDSTIPLTTGADPNYFDVERLGRRGVGDTLCQTMRD